MVGFAHECHNLQAGLAELENNRATVGGVPEPIVMDVCDSLPWAPQALMLPEESRARECIMHAEHRLTGAEL